MCRTTDLVTFYGLRYDEAADCLDAHIVLCEARRIDWLTGRVVGSQRADWTPVVVSAAERRQLAMQYSEALRASRVWARHSHRLLSRACEHDRVRAPLTEWGAGRSVGSVGCEPVARGALCAAVEVAAAE